MFRKHPNGHPSQLQIILCAAQSVAAVHEAAEQSALPQQPAHSPTASSLSSSPAGGQPSAKIDNGQLPGSPEPATAHQPAQQRPKVVADASADGSAVLPQMTDEAAHVKTAHGLLHQQTDPQMPDTVAALARQHHLRPQLIQVLLASTLSDRRPST